MAEEATLASSRFNQLTKRIHLVLTASMDPEDDSWSKSSNALYKKKESLKKNLREKVLRHRGIPGVKSEGRRGLF